MPRMPEASTSAFGQNASQRGQSDLLPPDPVKLGAIKGNDLVCLLKEGFLWFKDSHPIVKVIVFLAIFSFYTFWLIYDSIIIASITIGELILKHHIWIRVLTLVTTLLTLLILLY